MSVAGSSATGTWDQDQDVQLSSVNPMYNFVAHNVPSTYDEITQERMDRHSSPPPFQREQAAPGYLNRLPVQKAPTGFGEKLQLEFGGCGLGEFHDIHTLTMFADYRYTW